MDPNALGYVFGSTIIIGVDIALNGAAIYFSFKRKQHLWLGALCVNAVIGLFLPALVQSILPLAYLIRYRKYGKEKEKRPVKKGTA